MCVFNFFKRFRRRVRRFFNEKSQIIRRFWHGSPLFLEMSYSETRTKNIVGFEENWTRFYEFRLCFLSEFFIEPSRFFAGIDAAFSGMKLCDLRSSTAERRICGCLRARYASCFAGKNAAEFLFMRANDGSLFLIILRSQSAFLPLHLATLHAIKMTESVWILIGKVYLSALLRKRKDGGMCPARVAKCVLREQKTQSAVSFFEYPWLGLMQFNCGVLLHPDAPQARKSEENWE